MRELTQVRDAVVAALEQAGLPAMAAYPAERARRYAGAVATVAVGAAQGRTLGFCDYLGEVRDEDGAVRELYGKQLEAEIAVDIRGERAAECERGCEIAAEVLLGGGVPSGIRPGSLAWEALAWEKETGCFLRRGRLQCRAVFQAVGDGDGGAFLDFVLKGVLSA